MYLCLSSVFYLATQPGTPVEKISNKVFWAVYRRKLDLQHQKWWGSVLGQPHFFMGTGFWIRYIEKKRH
ncbi:hypothetical protein AWQ21_03895 [Picosynechococcus sp. PCC 7003]|nr:hypothetical protein AWQ21_03895 [Picosynechococcus sp. PCC 7003]